MKSFVCVTCFCVGIFGTCRSMEKPVVFIAGRCGFSTYLPKLMEFASREGISMRLSEDFLKKSVDRIRSVSQPTVQIDISEESDSWGHASQTASYDIEKLEIYNSEMGDDQFREDAIPYVLRDIDVLVEMYTISSLKKVPEIATLLRLLNECQDERVKASHSVSLLLR